MNYKILHRSLMGQIVDLVPMANTHAPDVVRLRNYSYVRRFFDNKEEPTIERQATFFENYLKRNDDLYWCVKAKSGKIIGTNRINEIDGMKGYKGSQIVDFEYAKLGPFALESDLLVIKFAFDVLGLQSVHALIRPDNVKVVSFNKQLGLSFSGMKDMRGIRYEEYVIERNNFNPQPLNELIDYFAKRQS